MISGIMIITLFETLIIKDITKTESINRFIIHCFDENNESTASHGTHFALWLEIMHCAPNLHFCRLR